MSIEGLARLSRREGIMPVRHPEFYALVERLAAGKTASEVDRRVLEDYAACAPSTITDAPLDPLTTGTVAALTGRSDVSRPEHAAHALIVMLNSRAANRRCLKPAARLSLCP